MKTDILPKVCEAGDPRIGREGRVKFDVLDTGAHKLGGSEVRLCFRNAGWNIAGSMMRWDADAYSVLWEAADGSRHGRHFAATETGKRAAEDFFAMVTNKETNQ